MWTSLLAPITSLVDKAVSRLSVDKDLALKLQSELNKEILTLGATELKGAVEVIVAEAKGESWLQRNWRPILMLSIIAIVINNYILAPYLHALGITVVTLPLPDKLFSLMEIGVGGYVIGRTGEKMLETWKKQ